MLNKFQKCALKFPVELKTNDCEWIFVLSLVNNEASKKST